MYSSQEPSDAEIAGRVVNGEKELFATLQHRYHGLMISIISIRMPPHLIEETVHDVFVRAYLALPGLKDGTRLRQWLGTLAIRTCHDFWRRYFRSREVVESSLSGEHRELLNSNDFETALELHQGQIRQREMREILGHALDTLPLKGKTVLILLYIQGLSGKEAACQLGCSEGSVKVRAFRSRQRLKTLLSA